MVWWGNKGIGVTSKNLVGGDSNRGDEPSPDCSRRLLALSGGGGAAARAETATPFAGERNNGEPAR